jgi:DNA-binding response OmpR family regulator
MQPAVILLVEDEPEISELLSFLLESAGYVTVQAPDGKQAIEALQRSAVDLVLTDVMMPAMDGLALIEAIRKSDRHARVPVLVHTSLPERIVRGMSNSFDAYLGKPVPFEHLLTEIGKLLAEQKERRRHEPDAGISLT